ncbi:MAG: hypothetical protein KC635_17920 [Myxococcales bacterium]|nr:hypothetical protein [Myxococcales bacterium]MCB9732182.1 hypothetical protein [Deltaproteobacteria bacterium]
MDRRGFLRRVVGAAAGAGAAVMAAGAARAHVACQPFDAYGSQTCVAGLKSEVAGSFASATGGQHMSQWCWAACIEMVFRHHGYVVPQARIVKETFGDRVNLPSSGWQILGNLNREWVDDRGRRFVARGDVMSSSPVTAAQDLAADQPLILGTQGHAMVLTAVEYRRDQGGNGQIVSAIVRDPWPGRGRRTLDPSEWYGVAFLARIRVAPA